MDFFEAHKQMVIDTVPSDRLLVCEAKQGWGPLCKFLNLPVPENPFPRSNETQRFKEIGYHHKMKSFIMFVGLPTLAFAIGAGVIYFIDKK